MTFCYYFGETLIGYILTNRVPDFEDEDNNFAIYNLSLIADTFISQFPILREGLSAAKGFSETPAGFSGVGTIAKGGNKVFQGLTAEEEIDLPKIIEGLNSAGGIIFKYPSSQIDVFLDATRKENEGDEVAPFDYFLRPPRQ